ncbi:maturase K [Gossypium australe]|uniref:Maturase K n=1 Tax=Gossypium australe TaxID=47621 RepID=A0A5B6VVB1_9ROSI|nr:maturase K [Gossypium australe]
MDPDRAATDDAASNAPAPTQENPNAQPPPPPPIPQPVPVAPQGIDLVFDELCCTPEESFKCVVSLLRDSAYRWLKTLTSIVPRERVTWDFFLEEF